MACKKCKKTMEAHFMQSELNWRTGKPMLKENQFLSILGEFVYGSQKKKT